MALAGRGRGSREDRALISDLLLTDDFERLTFVLGRWIVWPSVSAVFVGYCFLEDLLDE